MFERLDIYQQAMNQAYDSVLITTADLDRPGPAIVYVNQAFCTMTGFSPEEVIGATPRILQGPKTDSSVLQRLRGRLSAGQAFQGSTVNYRKDRTPYVVEWNINPVRDEEGRAEYFISVQRDITARVEAEQFNQTLLNSLGEGVFGINAEGQFTFVNPAGLQLLGYDREEELLGRNSHHLTHHTDAEGQPYPEEAGPIYQVMQTGVPLKAWRDKFWRSDGSSFPVETYATPLWRGLGTVFGGVVVFRDISEQKRLERELEHQATHDRLTGLHNRSFFDQILDKQIRQTTRYGYHLSLILLDIDHFKVINDAHGHLVGDEILKGLATRLASRLREADTSARWGGEEFVALLPNTQGTAARELAEDLREQVAQEAFPDVGRVTISLGVAALQPGDSAKDLTKRTDDALYAAKAAGRNQVRTA